MDELKKYIREIPDFPKKGILYYDITTLLKNAGALKNAVNRIIEHYMQKGEKIDKVVSMESRGFIFGSVLAYELEAGFVPIRKPGKLPAKIISQDFEKEYGKDAFEIHEDAVEEGENILIVDDLLATGGTCIAAIQLIEKLGGNIKGCAFLIELNFLKGREKIKGYDLFSLIQYDE
ncbi:MAG: adenine phosphoribosyltransferase [Candidatus Diapherotrites archaeon]